jgi:ketosteroid isomerase-like protein
VELWLKIYSRLTRIDQSYISTCRSKMRRIDILVSSSDDVQNERSVAERLIRSVAAGLDVSVSVSYSDRLRLKEEDEITALPTNGAREGTLLLSPNFWEYQDEAEQGYAEHIPNIDRYDLVICILWSGLGIRLAPTLVTPDGVRSSSAIDTEVAWVLDRSKRTPGFPTLHVYRNRATPTTPLEPKEKREIFCRQWDSVQEFFAAWEKNGGTEFPECCHDYQDLEEFEALFRAHFYGFFARQWDREIIAGRALRKARDWESNPFRGLKSFDFEHAAIYHGRTKAVGEVLDALKKQSTAKKRFVLVFGPAGSGKSSLVRAGVLPLLTQVRTCVGYGPWRHALTRPGAGGTTGDPFDTLAAALLAKLGLPELQDAAPPNEWRDLASQLRKDPDSAAIRITEVLDQLTRHESDHPLYGRESEVSPPRRSEGAEVVRQNKFGPIKPKVRLALIVDQLEELFTGGFSQVLQREYIAALGAVANCEGVFIIATLRSDFYAHYQQFPELIELTAFYGRYELQPPTSPEIGKMIRLPAEAAGLSFERDPTTGRSLDEALVEAAMASSEPLPLLEHLLSRLYQKQVERKDGLLRWSDYRGLGELRGALANHAETIFLTLKRDEQRALKFVIRHLVTLGWGDEAVLNRRTVPYRDLVRSPELDQQQKAGAKGLVDRWIKEGLLSAETDPKQELLINVAQEALLRRWSGVWQWLSEDRDSFRMRDRLDASLKLWLTRGCQTDDLFYSRTGLAEAEALVRGSGSSLSETQGDYIEKSLAGQKRRLGMRDNIGLVVVIAGLAVFGAVAGIGWFSTEKQRKKGEQAVQRAQQRIDLAISQRSALETQLKKAQEDAQQVQKHSDLAVDQPKSGETQPLNPAQNSESATSSQPLGSSVKSDHSQED